MGYTAMTKRGEIEIVIDIVSTKKINTVATHTTSTTSIICHSKKVRDCYILHMDLLAVILILIIIIIYCYYGNQK